VVSICPADVPRHRTLHRAGTNPTLALRRNLEFAEQHSADPGSLPSDSATIG
jgi:hypothetical protein